MGYSGGGKSFLARTLAARYGIPKLELDEVAYDLCWRPVDEQLVLPIIKEFMVHEDWIIDGNYNYLMLDERLEEADMIILILLPRILCLLRALHRTKERKTAGYRNDINLKFIRFLMYDCRNKRRRDFYKKVAMKYEHKTVVLKSQKHIDQFLDNRLF